MLARQPLIGAMQSKHNCSLPQGPAPHCSPHTTAKPVTLTFILQYMPNAVLCLSQVKLRVCLVDSMLTSRQLASMTGQSEDVGALALASG